MWEQDEERRLWKAHFINSTAACYKRDLLNMFDVVDTFKSGKYNPVDQHFWFKRSA